MAWGRLGESDGGDRARRSIMGWGPQRVHGCGVGGFVISTDRNRRGLRGRRQGARPNEGGEGMRLGLEGLRERPREGRRVGGADCAPS